MKTKNLDKVEPLSAPGRATAMGMDTSEINKSKVREKPLPTIPEVDLSGPIITRSPKKGGTEETEDH